MGYCHLLLGGESEAQVQKTSGFMNVLPRYRARCVIALMGGQAFEDAFDITQGKVQERHFRGLEDREPKRTTPVNIQDLTGLGKLRHPRLGCELALLIDSVPALPGIARCTKKPHRLNDCSDCSKKERVQFMSLMYHAQQ